MKKNYFLPTLKRLVKVALGRDVFFRPQVVCPKLHYGNPANDWTFCPTGLTKQSVLYSFGVGQDVSFDLAMIRNFGLNVYAFDPTPKSFAWLETQSLPPEFHHFPFGLSDHDGVLDFFQLPGQDMVSYTELNPGRYSDIVAPTQLKVKRLATICAEFSHGLIDVLKMDIEGSEYNVIPDLLNSNIAIHQILIEFHHHFQNVRVKNTIDAIKILNRHGYRIFSVSESGNEYSFMRV
jgi:FkbM family methyltransferase